MACGFTLDLRSVATHNLWAEIAFEVYGALRCKSGSEVGIRFALSLSVGKSDWLMFSQKSGVLPDSVCDEWDSKLQYF